MKNQIKLLGLIIAILGLLFACAKSKKNLLDTKPITYNFGDQNKDLWRELDSLENINKTESALKIVKEIQSRAMKQEHIPDFINALQKELTYSSILEEESHQLSLKKLDSAITASDFPQKQLLFSLKADFLKGYLNKNYYEISERTPMPGPSQKEMEYWTINQVDEEIKNNYFLSISDASSLKQIDIREFSSLIKNTSEGVETRPTLYDLLTFEIIDYLQNNRYNIHEKKTDFDWKNIQLLGSKSEFLAVNVNDSDSIDSQLRALSLIQELTQFHSDRKQKNASGLLDLYRLNLIANEANYENNVSVMNAAYQSIFDDYRGHDVQAEIAYRWMQYKVDYEDEFAPDYDSEMLTSVVALCDQMIEQYGQSKGAKNCESLKQYLIHPDIEVSMEEVVVSKTASPLQLNVKNVSKLYFKVVQLAEDVHLEKNYNDEKFIKSNSKKKGVLEWNVNLDFPANHRTYSFGEILPSLINGSYFLFVSDDPEFKISKEKEVRYTFFQASKTAVEEKRMESQSMYTLRDRVSGLPIPNVSIEVYENDYRSRRFKYELVKTLKSNAEGKFTLDYSSQSRQGRLKIITNDEVYFESVNRYNYRYNNEVTQQITKIYTDRAIYRPGQTIHFKAILMTKNDDGVELRTNTNTTLTLFDANYQKVDDLALRSNEYGSVSGTFIIPEGGLNGSYNLRDDHGVIRIKVEEYKRPKFEVTVDPIEGTYALNDEVNIKGKAMSFAGAPIDQGEVSYRVYRTARFPWWCWYRYGFQPRSEQQEITSGRLDTDKSGAFEFEFRAIPDESVDPKFSPTFNYQVVIDVTDINGETRSAEQRVPVSYQSLFLSHSMTAEWSLANPQRFELFAKNVNGESVETELGIEVYKLIEPERLYRKDILGSSKDSIRNREEWEEQLPLDALKAKPSPENLKMGELMFSSTYQTSNEEAFDIDNIDEWNAGRYKMELRATDASGLEVLEEFYFTAFDPNRNACPVNEVLWSHIDRSMIEPGEKVEILVGSADVKVPMRMEVFHEGKKIKEEIWNLNNEVKSVVFAVEEEHRGGLVFHFSFFKNNRWYEKDYEITVPYTNKELEVSFETFRSKLTPGQKEEWKVKIKGKNGEKVAAEYLAALYDASLDAFAENNFTLDLYNQIFGTSSGRMLSIEVINGQRNEYRYISVGEERFILPYFKWKSWTMYTYQWTNYRMRNISSLEGEMVLMEKTVAGNVTFADADMEEEIMDPRKTSPKESGSYKFEELNTGGIPANYGDKSGGLMNLTDVKARSNFNETAFFYPDLQTDKEGNVILNFTLPESLTEWKFISLAHTKDLSTGTLSESIIAQKDLMVTPNMPRFMREGDEIRLSAKINNLSEKDLSGQAQLFLTDTRTDETLKLDFGLENDIQSFEVKKDESTVVHWRLEVPMNKDLFTWKVVAAADDFSDGEEDILPILSSRMLVTESIPLSVRGNQTKNFTLEKLANAKSKSRQNHRLTLEYTSNPAWYAVQAMPYLMEYPYECAEQTFSRYYSNTLAEHLVNSNPKIKQIFDTWKIKDKDALLSNLEKNPELKSILLQETPWVLDAQNETEQKQKIALLFDINQMSKMKARALNELKELQSSDGYWSWFPGMSPSTHMTRHIVAGWGHLRKLGLELTPVELDMATRGLDFLDRELDRNYKLLKKQSGVKMDENHLNYGVIQYLYARSFYPEVELPLKSRDAYKYYFGQIQKYWASQGIYAQGMIALVLQREGEEELARTIVESLKENTIVSEEFGMYWKSNTSGYFWYQSPIEIQAIMIETFSEVTKDWDAVEELKIWLLKNKQTNHWKTTKATTEAIYAILLQGTDLLTNVQQAEIYLGNNLIEFETAEAGTGYVKKAWDRTEISSEMAEVKVVNPNKGISWGALYWQYFEDLKSITSSETGLVLRKELFVVKNSSTGEKLVPISEGIEIGDKIRVRIELESDRDMEYVHLKDMRASGFEPLNVLSQYKWQAGIGYYESTKDASTNFFMDYLRKGKYVFEYDLRAFQAGDFSNGIASIQCMYAPEFNAHSEGTSSIVKEK